jgi:hypothetical protein
MTQATAGWYADPSTPQQLRWFDGTAWTEHVHGAPVASYQAPVQQGYASVQEGFAPVQQAYSAQTAYTSNQAAYQPVVQGYPPQQQAASYAGCQVCGASPALPVLLREHHGMVVMQRFVTYRGQFCRDCGVAQFRHAQSRTLLFGWWGLISFFMTIAALCHNGAVYSKLRALTPPAGRVRAPLPERPSVFTSPGFAVVVVAIGLLLVVNLI